PDNYHAIFTSAITQLNRVGHFARVDWERAFLSHKIGLQSRFVRACKRLFRRLLGVELLLPNTLEVDRVNEVHHHVAWDLLDDCRNFAPSMLVNPPVDPFR